MGTWGFVVKYWSVRQPRLRMCGFLSPVTSTSSYRDALLLNKTSVSLATIYILANISRVYNKKDSLRSLIVFKYFFNMAKMA